MIAELGSSRLRHSMLLASCALAVICLLVPGWVLAATLVAAGLLALLIGRPIQGFYVALVLLPLSPMLAQLPLSLSQVAGPGFFFYLVVGVCLIGTVIRPPHRDPEPLMVPLLCFSAVVLLSALVNIWRFTSSGHLDYLSSGLKGVLSCFLAYLLTTRVISSLEQVRRITLAMIAISLVVSLTGIAQIMTFFLGIDFGYPAQFLAEKVSFGFRINATFDDAAFLAIYYLLILPLGVALVIGRSGLDRRTQAWIWGALLLAFPPFVLSFNKSSYLALVPALLLLAWLKRSWLLLGVLSLGISGALALAVWSGFLNTLLMFVFNFGGAEDVVGRLHIWGTALLAFVSEPHIPLIGAGPYGNRVIFEPMWWSLGAAPSHSHNEVLELITNYGLIGTGIFLVLLYRIGRIAWQMSAPATFLQALRQGFLCAFLALVLQATVFPIFTFLPAFWIMAGVLVRANTLARSSSLGLPENGSAGPMLYGGA